MTFLNPYGWLLLLCLPLLYFLSHKHKDMHTVELPSTVIWQKLHDQMISQQNKKLSPSLLLLIQGLIILCALLGMLDLSQSLSKSDEIVILYDNSLSMERVKDYSPLKDYIKANHKKTFQVIVINDTISVQSELLSAIEAEDLILNMSVAKKALDVSLLQSTYDALIKKNKEVLILSDKSALASLNTIRLDANTHNIGIRYCSYNYEAETLEIELENDQNDLTIAPLEITYNGKILYKHNYYLEGLEQELIQIKTADFTPKIKNTAALLTVRLALDDSILSDNSQIIVYAPSIAVSPDNQDESLLKVIRLLPYVYSDNIGKPLMAMTEVLPSDVDYDRDFIQAIKEEGLTAKRVKQSPFYPLWVEDHLKLFYEKAIIDLENQAFLSPLPRRYTVHDKVIKNLEIPSHKNLPPSLFFLSFLMLIIVEEEVRRRV